MRAWICFAVLAAFAVNITSGKALAGNRVVPDVSWPNCPIRIAISDAGIVGVNGGLDFRPNPCLAQEAGLFKQLSAYVNSGYPGRERALKFKNYPLTCSANDEKCLAYNYGYYAGLYDIKYASMQGVVAKQWWLDVENVNSWSDNPLINRQALSGMADAIARYAGEQNVGYYSYPGQWDKLTDNWRNGFPAWVATGSLEKSDAIAACLQPSFTGGPVELGQFTLSLDQNYICSP